MILVIYKQTEKLNDLRISGHALYAPRGYDIICSAVSAIYFSLCEYLSGKEILADMAGDENKHQVLAERGDKSDLGFEFALGGLENIAKEYPDNVKVEKLR